MTNCDMCDEGCRTTYKKLKARKGVLQALRMLGEGYHSGSKVLKICSRNNRINSRGEFFGTLETLKETCGLVKENGAGELRLKEV